MNIISVISHKLYYAKKEWWKNNRLLFPSPAEVKFIEIMGGQSITFEDIRHIHTGFPLTIILSMGKILRREYIHREIRVGAMYIDFGVETRYFKKGIEIDGKAFHRDIVKEQERDDYCAKYGWKLLHIQATDLYRIPETVKKSVIKFLSQ